MAVDFGKKVLGMADDHPFSDLLDTETLKAEGSEKLISRRGFIS